MQRAGLVAVSLVLLSGCAVGTYRPNDLRNSPAARDGDTLAHQPTGTELEGATGAAQAAAAMFLEAIQGDDLKALEMVVDSDEVCREAKFWPWAAKVLRRMYAADIARLSRISDSYVDGGIAAFRVEHPEGRKGYLLIVAVRFPDGNWRVIEAQTDTQEGINLRAASEHYGLTYKAFRRRRAERQ